MDNKKKEKQREQLTNVSNAWVLLMSISGGKMLGNCRKPGMKGETLAAATTAAIWLLACSVGDCAAAGGRLLFPPATTTAAPLMPAATPTDAPDDSDVSFASLNVADDAAVVVKCFLLALFEPLPTLPPPPLPMLQLAALLNDLAPRSVPPPPPVLELAAGRLTPPLPPPPPPPPALLLPLLS